MSVFVVALHDYNICFNGSPLFYSLSYNNYNSVRPHYIVVLLCDD